MKKVCSILLLLLSAVSYYASAQDIHFTMVEPSKEDPWSGVLAMTQDLHGYLWFATKEGVYKYDGHQYKLYQHEPSNPNSLSLNWVESIFADKNGIIWIGTYGGGLDKLDPVANQFTHYRHQPGNKASLVNDKVAAVIADRNGSMWIGTLGGLERFDPKTGHFTHFVHDDNDPESISNNAVRVVYEDRQGTIWAGTGSPFNQDDPTQGGGLNKLDKRTGKFTRYMHDPTNPNSLASNVVRVIFEDSRGNFWVGTAGDGLHTMNRKKGTFERYPYNPAHPEKLSRPAIGSTISYGADHITFITEDNSGKIWIGTFQGGINVYDPATKKTVWYGKGPNAKQALTQNEFWCAYKSREGIIWIASWTGGRLYKVSPYQNRLPFNYLGKDVEHFTERPNNSLWIATPAGLIHQDGNNNRQFYYYKSTKFGTEKGSDNDLWTIGGGLLQFNPATGIYTRYINRPGDENSLSSDSILSIKKGAPGKLWVGTNGSGLDEMDIKSGIFRHFRHNAKDATSISGDFVFALERTGNTIWAGTEHGVNKLGEKTGRFKRYLGDVRIFTLLRDNNENLVAATATGLYRYDKKTDSFFPFGAERTEVFDATEDHNGNFWIAKPKGLAKLDFRGNQTIIYGKNEGVSGVTIQAFHATAGGEILIGDTAGYFAFYPDKLLHNTPAPVVDISGFLLADIPVMPSPHGILTQALFNTKKISLNHDQTTFSFTYADIDFVSDGAGVRNFYMLENYDGKWRKGSSDQNANYFNVPPGKYVFRIKAVNTNGLVSEKHIAIIILPPWWQTWWAYVLFALLFAGSIWAFIYYRSLTLLKEKRVLEHKVQRRTEEVLQQKKEIEAQRDSLEHTLDELKNTQVQLVQREKMASLGELTAGIAHEIQNPLNFVNNFSDVNSELIDEMQQEIEKGDLKEVKIIAGDIKENQQKISHHGKRADAIVKGMLQHSRSGSGAKELTDINKLADEYLRLAYHGLRAKDKSFNAGLVTDFDKKLPQINVVPQDIGRVLVNLFTNAFYAVNQKQQTAGKDYKPEVSVTTTTENGQVVIKVKDNGNGIPESIKDKIMQPFFTTKPTGEGTGLGLSLSYDIVVKGHGGSIYVNSVDGEGSEFIMNLSLNG